jgi:MFS family permease
MLKLVRFRSAIAEFVRLHRISPQKKQSFSAIELNDGDRPGLATRFGLSGLWRNADFLKFWAADGVSETGSQITLLALPLLAALSLKASPGQMGLLTAAGTAPSLLFGLFAGVWVDRVRRRRLMMAADIARFLLLLVIPGAWALGVLRFDLLYAVTFLSGSLRVFFNISFMSYVPELVGREHLLEGNSKLQSTASLAQVTGPALAGVLVGLLGAAYALLLDAFSFLASALFLKRIRQPEAEPDASIKHPPAMRGIGQGLRLVFGNATLRAMMLSSSFTSFFGYVFLAVYILYMVDSLKLSSSAVGLIFGLGGLGALIGALLAAPIARRFGIGRTIIGGRILFGLCGAPVPLAVLLPSIALPLVLAAEFSQWLMLTVADVNSMSLRQAITPDRYLGRVNATSTFIVGGAVPLGSLFGGLLGELIGIKATLVVGIIGFMLAAVWVYFSPLQHLREQPAPLEIDEPAAVATSSV